MSTILIQNTQILTMTGQPLYSGDILIENDTIAALGTVTPEQAQGARVIDGRHTLAMPGLINAHTHSPMTLLRSYADDMPLMPWLQEKIWPAEAKFTGDHYYWGAMLAMVEMIQSGTTTFADMYFDIPDIARAVTESGLRANLSPTFITAADPDGSAIAEGVQLHRAYHDQADGRIKIWFAPHAPYTCTPDHLERIVTAATDCDTGIHVHLAETQDELRQIREGYGKTSTVYLRDLGVFTRPTLAAHGIYLNDGDLEILTAHSVSVAHNPTSNLKLASGIADVAKYRRRGLNVALGTDGASSNNSLNLFKEMSLCSLIQKVHTMDPTTLPAEAILEMATVNGAKALHWDREIGTLEVGKQADLILIDTDKAHFAPWNNPVADLVYSAQAADVKTSIVHGQILMENYQVLTLDVEQIKAEAARHTRAILG